jgi:hypothetical protein
LVASGKGYVGRRAAGGDDGGGGATRTAHGRQGGRASTVHLARPDAVAGAPTTMAAHGIPALAHLVTGREATEAAAQGD